MTLALFGCAQKAQPQAPQTNDQSITFTDSEQNQVTVPSSPKKVAVLFASYADIWQNAGGKISIGTGDIVTRGYVPEGQLQIVAVGAGKEVNLELLLTAKPDFVILSSDIKNHQETAKVLRDAGIPAALFREDSFSDYLNMLSIFTHITGDNAAYQKYGTDVQTRIEQILETAKQQKDNQPVLLIRAFSSGADVESTDNFVGEMLSELGCDNIAAHAKVLLKELSLEAIVTENPGFIFVTTMGDDTAALAYMNTLMTEHPAWRELSAVKSGRYVVLPKEMFQYKPNSAWADAYVYLAQILYPEASFK